MLGAEQTFENNASWTVHGEYILSILGGTVREPVFGHQVISPTLSGAIEVIAEGHWRRAVFLPVGVVGLKELLLKGLIFVEQKLESF